MRMLDSNMTMRFTARARLATFASVSRVQSDDITYGLCNMDVNEKSIDDETGKINENIDDAQWS